MVGVSDRKDTQKQGEVEVARKRMENEPKKELKRDQRRIEKGSMKESDLKLAMAKECMSNNRMAKKQNRKGVKKQIQSSQKKVCRGLHLIQDQI